MSKKHIAFVIFSLSSGGAERVVSLLANTLTHKYKVTVITLLKSEPFYTLNKEINLISCLDHIFPSKTVFEALYLNYRLIQKLVSILRTEKIVTLIGFMTESNVLAVVATKCVGIPVIISERNNPFQESKHLSKFWKVLRRLTYPRANYLVVQTNFIKKFYEKIISQERLKIIPNPINVNFIDFGESKRENIILNVGRLTEQKNHQLLIRTFSKINPPSWELHIAGDGPLRNELKHLIKETEMEGKIKLLGRIKDVATLYQKSKVFALTSKYEGFPNALLEAMHFGLACVSTDCPSGPSELIQDGINGYLTPVDNHELFSEKLKDLVFDENLRVLMGTKAAISVDHLEANKIAIQWLQLINQSLKD